MVSECKRLETAILKRKADQDGGCLEGVEGTVSLQLSDATPVVV